MGKEIPPEPATRPRNPPSFTPNLIPENSLLTGQINQNYENIAHSPLFRKSDLFFLSSFFGSPNRIYKPNLSCTFRSFRLSAPPFFKKGF
jgi:hypothetical protein